MIDDINQERIDDILRPKLRLFMSVDLEGSTALKNETGILPLKNMDEVKSKIDLFPGWHKAIFEFFYEFDDLNRLIQSEYSLFRNIHGQPKIENPKVFFPQIWKRKGDEIIYSVEIIDSYHFVYCLIFFLTSIAKYRENFGIESQDVRENDVKATIWLAGFPLVNTETAFINPESQIRHHSRSLSTLNNLIGLYRIDNTDDNRIDYIGPSVDIGFRISTLANNIKIPINVEVAYILSTVFDVGNENPNFTILEKYIKFNEEKTNYKFAHETFYDGEVNLKGVFDERGYPFFWLKAPFRNTNPLHQNKYFSKSCSKNELKLYFESYFKARKNFLLIPYLPKCDLLKHKDIKYIDYLESWKHEMNYLLKTNLNTRTDLNGVVSIRDEI